MTDQVMHEGYDDLRLVTEYLNHQLDPERVAIVRRRLEEDQAFREWAAPLLLAWSVPKRHEREPLPRGEIEKRWDEFTKRAGFIHQKRRARKRWLTIIAIAVIALGVTAFALRQRVRDWYEDRRDYAAVPWQADWIALPSGAQVKLEPGAHMKLRRTPRGDIRDVKLQGAAEFRAAPPQKPGELIPTIQPVAIITRGCVIMSARGEFGVAARGDSTAVVVHKPASPFWAGFIQIPTKVMMGDPGRTNVLSVGENRRGRCVRGEAPLLEKEP